ncbi:UNVERIFIED_CONTAM: UBP1-associated proteins 1C [Sesamum radiatum]|uniref:UBP1-associated proteins 1C n=1 Tax=Sesamum radiatum TaxID=300843 RepID=A0AAW2NP44_SESRA
MVWFQCEDCGDNLKKPKLPNHFRVCSAYKLSCIDCGQVFGQQDVESHTQCITEAEKYGPKGQGNALNGSNTKPKKDSKPKPEVDINVGLSERPPWFCSLCNTKATSKQALLLHADGKKHRAKARAFHAAKQQPNDTAGTKGSSENNAKAEAPENKIWEKIMLWNQTRKENSRHLKMVVLRTRLENPDGAMKLKKLRKFVLNSLKESGHTEDKNQVSEILSRG